MSAAGGSKPASARRLRVALPDGTVLADLQSFRAMAQRKIERALGKLQVALAEAETDNGNPVPAIRGATKSLRDASVSLECLRGELAQLVPVEQAQAEGAAK